MHVVVDKLATNYSQHGDGKVVILLHGWGDSSVTFAELQKSLTTRFRVISLDLPGFGATEAPQDAWDLSDYAKFVAHFLDKIGESPYAIIGHSNGGAVAIRGLSAGILSAERLVLLASSGVRDEYQGRKKAIRLIAKSGKVATSLLPRRYQRKIRSKVYEKLGSDMLVAEHMQETFKRIIADDVQSDAPNVSVKTLLLYGSEDTATPPHIGETFAKLIPDAQFACIEGAGHFIHHDAKQTVNSKIEAFL